MIKGPQSSKLKSTSSFKETATQKSNNNATTANEEVVKDLKKKKLLGLRDGEQTQDSERANLDDNSNIPKDVGERANSRTEKGQWEKCMQRGFCGRLNQGRDLCRKEQFDLQKCSHFLSN